MDNRRPLTQAELNSVLALHERHIMSVRSVHTDLKNTKLDGLNLANRNLSGVDFTGASLVGATLFGSNLTRCRLYGADLRRSDLRNANMTGADLRGASLNLANLSFAKLDKADMRSVVMLKTGTDGLLIVDCHDSMMRNRGAVKVGVDFSNSSLKGASFDHAKLQGVDFSGALLNDAKFGGAQLKDAKFRGAVLTGVDLKELAVPPETLEDCVLDVTAEALSKAESLKLAIEQHRHWVASDGKAGAPAVLDGEDLRPLGAALAGLALTALSARRAIAIGIDFSRCQLQGARFDGADLREANFSDTDLAGASFKDAKLAHATFRKARLSKLELVSGGSALPDFEGTQATEEQFEGAMLDGSLLHAFAPAGA